MAKPVRRSSKHTPAPLTAPLSPFQRPIELTKREQMILNHVWLGAQNQAIAQQLRISIRTVEAHRAMIMRKFGVTNVAQLRSNSDSLKTCSFGRILVNIPSQDSAWLCGSPKG